MGFSIGMLAGIISGLFPVIALVWACMGLTNSAIEALCFAVIADRIGRSWK